MISRMPRSSQFSQFSNKNRFFCLPHYQTKKLNSFSLFLEIYKVILVVCFTRKYILVSLNLGIARNLEANDTGFTDYYWTETVSFRTTVERKISGTPNITPSPEVKCNLWLGLVAGLEIASLFFPIDWKGSLKKTALRKYGFGNFTGWRWKSLEYSLSYMLQIESAVHIKSSSSLPQND